MRCAVRIRLFSPRLLANCLQGRRFFISPRRWRAGADSQGNVGHLCFVLLLFDRSGCARPPSEAEGNVCLPLGASCPLINLFSFGRCVMCLARVGVGVGVGNRSQSALGAMPSPDRDFGVILIFFQRVNKHVVLDGACPFDQCWAGRAHFKIYVHRSSSWTGCSLICAHNDVVFLLYTPSVLKLKSF